ncbi:sugar phosphate isomerase/epimerase family protein [Rhodohalobacter sp. 614A]|uniref:sugar phosphate isomerase/epimerase family protein n=1 Tax=Rhodohalobacter sp. 614A TaxID=2908649 RepID=UPI001F1FA746|nr:sugar phosphate isomerase/epimerase [Rhodohalobacter sp. 614A]
MKKNVILTITFFVTLLTTQFTVAQNSGEPIYTDEFGIQMYTFRNVIPEKGLEETLDIVADMGIKYIEGGPGQGQTAEEYLQMLDERGLELISTGSGFGELRDNPQAVADRAKELGAKFVMNAWIDHEVGNFNFLNASEAVEVFNKAGKVMAENGLTLMYHAHGYEFQPHGKGTLFDYMVENTDPDNVKFQMDILWAHFGGANPEHLLKKYPDRWVSLHLKDLRKGTLKDHTGLTDTDNDVILGTGELNIPNIINTANEIGIDYMFIEDESSDPLYQVPKTIEYLKSLTKDDVYEFENM